MAVKKINELLKQYLNQEQEHTEENSEKLQVAYDYVDGCGEKDRDCCSSCIAAYCCCGC